MRSLLIGLLLALAVPVAAQPPATSSDSASIAKALHRGCANGQVLVKDTARPGEVRCATLSGGGGGASPSSAGLQYWNGTAWVAITGSSVSGADVTLGGTIKLPSGDVGAPAYSFTADPNLGIYRDVSNTLSYGSALGVGVSGSLAPESASTLALGAVGTTTNGAHQFYVTFVTDDGETTVSPVATITISATKNVDISDIPTSSNARVTDRNIYVTKSGEVGAANAHLFTTISDNTTTDYTFDAADADLTGDPPPTTNTTGIMVLSVQGNTPRVSRISPLSDNAGLAFGWDALYANTTGLHNVAIGFDALTVNTTGNQNIAIGREAMDHNTSGDNNVAVGYGALINSATGGDNVGLGRNALSVNTTGGQNVAIGKSAGPSANNLDDTIAIGTNAAPSVGGYAVIGAAGYITDVFLGGETATATVHAAGYAFPEVAFASLPGSPSVGQLANVSDSNTATWGANVAAGGANHILARWNGVAWTVVGK